MYKPGASFYDPTTDKTLVCCSGNVYASLGAIVNVSLRLIQSTF